MITPWKVGASRPIKQSNFGTYRQSISTGEGMGLRRVTLTGDTPEIVQDAAAAAASASALLTQLEAALIELASYAGVDIDNPLPWFKSFHAEKYEAIANAKGIKHEQE